MSDPAQRLNASRLVLLASLAALGVLATNIMLPTFLLMARDLYHGAALTRALALVMIAMAAAPGFSPAPGTVMAAWFGWRSVFVLVALAAALVALHYRFSLGEILSSARRRPAHPFATVGAYAALVTDARFITPALAVSLVIGYRPRCTDGRAAPFS